MSEEYISGWGRYPSLQARVLRPQKAEQIHHLLKSDTPFIPRGLGRSYGDASLANRICETTSLDLYSSFDAQTGSLRCEAGVSLDRILKTFAPRGWFLQVTPGTRYVTVGGAIASDVHGKNHHNYGCFSESVEEMDVLTGSGEIVTCSPRSNTDLFRATCGGMGLTGVIVSVTLKLRKIASTQIRQTIIKAPDLDSILDQFAENAEARYSVAWIDCVTKGRNMGRALLMLGDHADPGESLAAHRNPKLSVPFNIPAALLNQYSVRLLNELYYRKTVRSGEYSLIHYAPFFYPLDAIGHWNRCYGRQGFIQYQLVIPNESARSVLHQLFARITASGLGSFLAVLKSMGQGNQNYLSFPIKGYTLALDFKYSPEALELMKGLDQLVIAHGGRLYLSKDARMSEQTFKASYPQWTNFQETRGKYGALGVFASSLSMRLGLES